MERNEVEELLSRIGVISAADKEAFRNMYNYVFDPQVKLPPPPPPLGNNPPLLQPETEPAIRAFLTVFRKHFRTSANPINLSTACKQAEAEFKEALLLLASQSAASCSSQMTPDEAKLWDQTQVLKGWITEVDNDRRDKFRRSAREDALESFKAKLSGRYSFDSILFYNEADILRCSKQLETKIVDEFCQDVKKFTKRSELAGEVNEFRHQLSQLVTDAVLKNKKNREEWNEKTEAAAADFKQMMEPYFLKTHPFAKLEAVESFRDQARIKCEETHGLSKVVATDPGLKSAWNAKVDKEYGNLQDRWKAEGDKRMQSFLKTVKAGVQKAFRENFGGLELEGGEEELERMSCQVAQVARLNLEKKSCSRDEDNIIQEEDDMEATTSSESSIASIGVAHTNDYQIIIAANPKLPTEVFRGCAGTANNNQPSARLPIYEGNNPEEEANSTKLGEIRWTDIPPAKIGVQKLDYSMKIDALGMLHVEWWVRGSSGKMKQAAQFKTSAWKGKNKESDKKAGYQGGGSADDADSPDDDGKNKRSVGAGSSSSTRQEQDTENSRKKVKLQEEEETTDSSDSDICDPDGILDLLRQRY